MSKENVQHQQRGFKEVLYIRKFMKLLFVSTPSIRSTPQEGIYSEDRSLGKSREARNLLS
jgi:hypothetical protein